MKQLLFGVLAIAALSVTSCTKDGDKPVNNGGSATIQGDWKVSSILTKEDGYNPYTYQGKTTDYYKFGADGHVSVKVDEFEATVTYTLVDASHVNIDGDVEEIKELTDHKLVLHSPATSETPEDITATLTR